MNWMEVDGEGERWREDGREEESVRELKRV